MDFSNLDKKFNSVLGPSTLSDVLNDNSCPRLPWLTFRFKPEVKRDAGNKSGGYYYS